MPVMEPSVGLQCRVKSPSKNQLKHGELSDAVNADLGRTSLKQTRNMAQMHG